MDRLTEAASNALQAAIALAKDNSQGVCAPAHLVSALLNPTQTQTGQTQQTLLHSILNKGESPSSSPRLAARAPPPHALARANFEQLRWSSRKVKSAWNRHRY